MSLLKPEASLGVGLATATLVYAIHQGALPSLADVRSLDANNADIDKSTVMAGWTSAAVVSGISLLAKDATVFVIGGTMVVALQWWFKHGNQVVPSIGRASMDELGSATPRVTQAEAPALYSVPETAAYESVI